MTPPRPSRPSRTNADVSKTLGKATTKSGQQAKAAADRAAEMMPDATDPIVPRAADGFPLAMIEMATGELIPTGQFANVSIGPGRVRIWIDPRDPESYWNEEIAANIAQVGNSLNETLQIDIMAVQRNLTLESMQSQISGD